MQDIVAREIDPESGVARITLSRPCARNAFDAAMRRQFRAAMDWVEDRSRVLVIEGAGAAFSTGHDFSAEPAGSGDEAARVLCDEYQPMIRSILECPVPVIAAVNGPAIGVGAAIALAADITVMQERAFFSMPFLGMGLVPDAGIMPMLTARAGSQRALGALLFGERIPAASAVAWGLAWEAVPRRAFIATVTARAAAVAALPREAVRGLKTLNAGIAGSLSAEWCALEAALQAHCVRDAMTRR